MAGLVHESATIEFPSAAPLGLVIIDLGTSPEDVEMNHVDSAEALFFYGLLEQLQRGVAAVLLDNE